MSLAGEGIDVIELRLADVVLIQGDIKLALYFSDLPLRVAQKFRKFGVASSVESLGDIVHH